MNKNCVRLYKYHTCAHCTPVNGRVCRRYETIIHTKTVHSLTSKTEDVTDAYLLSHTECHLYMAYADDFDILQLAY